MKPRSRQVKIIERYLNQQKTSPVQLESESAQAEVQDPEVAQALSSAAWLQEQTTAFDPPPDFVSASQARLLTGLMDRPLSWRQRLQQGRARWRDHRSGYRLALQASWLLLILAFAFNLSQLSLAARQTIPGDLFYPLKIAQENARLLFAWNPAAQARLHMEFSRHRLLEIQSLVMESRSEYLPVTVARFERYVSHALQAIHRVASTDPEKAQALAIELQEVLADRDGLLQIMANLAPWQNQVDFHRLISISEAGILDVRELLLPSGLLPGELRLAWQQSG